MNHKSLKRYNFIFFVIQKDIDDHLNSSHESHGSPRSHGSHESHGSPMSHTSHMSHGSHDSHGSYEDKTGIEKQNFLEQDEMTNEIDIVKHEMNISTEDMEQCNEDIFHSDILLPIAAPSCIKDKKEVREKTKKEIEEEDREKMQ